MKILIYKKSTSVPKESLGPRSVFAITVVIALLTVLGTDSESVPSVIYGSCSIGGRAWMRLVLSGGPCDGFK